MMFAKKNLSKTDSKKKDNYHKIIKKIDKLEETNLNKNSIKNMDENVNEDKKKKF